jgi:hypothetical protein
MVVGRSAESHSRRAQGLTGVDRIGLSAASWRWEGRRRTMQPVMINSVDDGSIDAGKTVVL